MVERFYKYGSFGKYSEDLFSTPTLWFSAPAELNDPFECRPWFTFDGGCREEIIDQLKRELQRQDPDASEYDTTGTAVSIYLEGRHRDPVTWENLRKDIITKLGNEIGLCCFSERSDSILMWSHYGYNHTGFCLEFSATDQNPFFGLTQKVNYSEELPVVDIYKTPNEQQVDLIFLTKHSGWSYEQEWRMIDHEFGPGLHEYPAESLTGVIFGLRTSQEHKNQVREWIGRRGHNVRIYQATQNERRFAIEIQEIE